MCNTNAQKSNNTENGSQLTDYSISFLHAKTMQMPVFIIQDLYLPIKFQPTSLQSMPQLVALHLVFHLVYHGCHSTFVFGSQLQCCKGIVSQRCPAGFRNPVQPVFKNKEKSWIVHQQLFLEDFQAFLLSLYRSGQVSLLFCHSGWNIANLLIFCWKITQRAKNCFQR